MGYIDRDDSPLAFEGFAEEFAWDGTEWLYYRDGWRAPVAISDDEYRRAIAWDEHGLLAVIAGVALLGVAMIFAPLTGFDRWPGVLGSIVGLLAGVLVASAGLRMIRWLATRTFRGRRPVGTPPDRDFLARRKMNNLSWGQMIFGILCFGGVAAQSFVVSPTFGWVPWTFVVMIWLYQAYRKWRLDRSPANPDG